MTKRYTTGMKASLEEMDLLIKDSLKEIEEIGISELHRRLKKYNLQPSNELYRSVKSEIIRQAGEIESEIRLSFRLYGRYQDMKLLNYVSPDQPRNSGKKYKTISVEEGLAEAPDIVKGMYEWLKTVKFRINGKVYRDGKATYERFNELVKSRQGVRRMPTKSMTMYRMAWTLAIARMKKNRVKSRRPGWYNEARWSMAHKGTVLMAKKVRNLVMGLVKSDLEDVKINL